MKINAEPKRMKTILPRAFYGRATVMGNPTPPSRHPSEGGDLARPSQVLSSGGVAESRSGSCGITTLHGSKFAIATAVIFFGLNLLYGDSVWKPYQLYQPTLEYTTIWKGKYDPDANSLAYNHCAAIEFFNGKFYAMWQGNISGVEGHNINRGTPVELWLRTSDDFKSWSDPAKFLSSEKLCENPFKGATQQVQAGLLNYNGNELWCFFLHQGNKENDGLYLSRLNKGGKWKNERILPSLVEIGGKMYSFYTSVSPVVFSSGRIALPLTFISQEQIEFEKGGKKTVQPKRFNGVVYSDNEGTTWQFSNLVSHPSDFSAMWEPAVYEQADGKIRLFVRNLFHPATGEPQSGQFLSCVGRGVQKGTPMVFDEDAQLCPMELFGDRAAVVKLTAGRFFMLHHDLFTYQHKFSERRNTALFFSRGGGDDFVAGPVITAGDEAGSYAQGIEANGKLFVLYTTGKHIRKPDPETVEFDIKGVCIDPAPGPASFYIWPRNRSKFPYKVPFLTNTAEKTCVVFEQGASAGVETDPVFNGTLEAEFSFKITELQKTGDLILCSFGDKLPVRIGVPSNRPDALYAYTDAGWQKIGSLKPGAWQKLQISFQSGKFVITLNEMTATFRYPANGMNPRFYLGDGYEVDRQYPSNTGSAFMIDLMSFKTRVLGK